MTDWNPDHYLRFARERTQPSIDLVARIESAAPQSIIDIGCGPGNSTRVLARRWPGAALTGLDNSPGMIAKARETYPACNWILADAAAYTPEKTFDIVFSNATLQWLPGHETLISRLFSMVSPAGALAIQVPANQGSPLHHALLKTAARPDFKQYTGDCDKLLHYYEAGHYYDILAGIALRLDLWETTYLHVLPDHRALIEWYKSTGMRPFLDRLPHDEARARFENQVLNECCSSYPVQADGKILFPFRRLFFIAYKAATSGAA